MAASFSQRLLVASAPAALTRTPQRRAPPRRSAPPARAAKSRGEAAPAEVAQRTGKSELVFDSAPALASAPAGASLARQLYSETCEAAVNAQINVEVRTSGARPTARPCGAAAALRNTAPGRPHDANTCYRGPPTPWRRPLLAPGHVAARQTTPSGLRRAPRGAARR